MTLLIEKTLWVFGVFALAFVATTPKIEKFELPTKPSCHRCLTKHEQFR